MIAVGGGGLNNTMEVDDNVLGRLLSNPESGKSGISSNEVRFDISILTEPQIRLVKRFKKIPIYLFPISISGQRLDL